LFTLNEHLEFVLVLYAYNYIIHTLCIAKSFILAEAAVVAKLQRSPVLGKEHFITFRRIITVPK